MPRPLAQADEDHVFLVWHHQQFSSYSDADDQIDSNFCEIFRYLQALNGTQFLVICAIWMKIAGFDEIYICDSRGDSGVDLLGVIEDGGLRSLVMAVQAKTSSSPVGENVVLTERRKYKRLPKSARYSEYCRSLRIAARTDGNSWNYAFLTNHTFNWSAREVSRELGVLLRSVHQIAFLLSRHYSKSQIALEVRRLSPSISADLSLNYRDRLAI